MQLSGEGALQTEETASEKSLRHSKFSKQQKGQCAQSRALDGRVGGSAVRTHRALEATSRTCVFTLSETESQKRLLSKVVISSYLNFNCITQADVLKPNYIRSKDGRTG